MASDKAGKKTANAKPKVFYVPPPIPGLRMYGTVLVNKMRAEYQKRMKRMRQL